MSVVLMYHGIFPDGDNSSIDPEDQPYALSVSEFTRQLDLLVESNVGLFSTGKSPDVVITFDDGHASNLHLAAPRLLERNLAAYFFVTSNYIDQRQGFLSGVELSELSRLPGMCIGSHGVSHRFFDDLSVSESETELLESRETLENLCGSACLSISLPGGRFLPRTLDQLANAGYRQCFGSQIGLIHHERFRDDDKPDSLRTPQTGYPGGESVLQDRWALAPQCDVEPLERVAIRHNTHLAEFRRIICQEPAYFRRKRLNSQVKHIARRVIGNRLYHGLYKTIVAR